MSPFCPASYNMLVIHDEDLGNLHSGSTEQLLERRIDIKLACEFSISDTKSKNHKLEVLKWVNNSTIDLCGSCSFCILLADGIQRNAESSLGPSWDLSSELDSALLSNYSKFPVTICFEKLEYQIDRGRQILDRLQLPNTSDYYCDLYLLLLTGYTILHLDGTHGDGRLKRSDVELAFELFGEEDDNIVKFLKISRRPLKQPRLSDQNVALMIDWLGDCDKTHVECWTDSKHPDVKVQTTFLPTRLIDVGNLLNCQPLRLIITSDIRPIDREATRYIALSYCWGPVDGTSKLLKTTQATLASKTKQIQLEDMPQAFQDAITVARRLGIQYLWIDSLCIIQDDVRDWQIESSKMAEIFSNAYLTIIAACGSGCNDSFLNPAISDLSCTLPLRLSSGTAIEGRLSLRYRRRRMPYDKMSDIQSSRHITRGWTFQEERLARRTLTFGESKFFFDCRSFQKSQDMERYVLRPDWATIISPRQEETKSSNNEVRKGWNHWQTLCAHYSRRELTFPEDKLPAISGMANRAAQNFRSEYLAGLWKDNLMHDLFWQIVTIATKPRVYRAPSWSWASLEGRVHWPMWRDFLSCSGCRMYCTILDGRTILGGLDPYGSVNDGFLKVRGVLACMKIVSMGEDKARSSYKLCHGGQKIGCAELDLEDRDIQIHNGENTHQPLQALLVAECRGQGERKRLTRGLLLVQNGRKRDECDEFERVGTFTLFPTITLNQGDSLDLWGSNAECVFVIV